MAGLHRRKRVYFRRDGRRAPQHHHPHRPAQGGKFELDLVLRNNITTEEHPLGVYHPHAELHHIKKENIGLIEVMGLAVLPVRLKEELAAVAEALVSGTDLRASELTENHADWAEGFKGKYDFTMLKLPTLLSSVERRI